MRCPFCSTDDTKVIDSRLIFDGSQIRRRRECASCHERFTSYETAETSLPTVIKRNGAIEPFIEAKLRFGISKAIEKRPLSVNICDAMILRIKKYLRSLGKSDITTALLGEIVALELKKVDEVSYIRFASVYRRFQNVNEFKIEIEKLATEEDFNSD